jgi:hypothetical protein
LRLVMLQLNTGDYFIVAVLAQVVLFSSEHNLRLT